MSERQETIADIIAGKRLRAAEMEKILGDQHSSVESLKDNADRLEAAWKREKSVIEADALSAVGNAAKMREALGNTLDALKSLSKSHGTDLPEDVRALLGEMAVTVSAALAAPPRNCDMPLVVDGPADNDADKAWLAFKHHNPDAYFDVSGLLRCIDWLLAPATEQEGGAK